MKDYELGTGFRLMELHEVYREVEDHGRSFLIQTPLGSVPFDPSRHKADPSGILIPVAEKERRKPLAEILGIRTLDILDRNGYSVVDDRAAK